jgi:hypothetical protein
VTDKEKLDELFRSVPSSARRPAASTAPEPLPAAPRPTPRPDPDGAREQRALREREERREVQERDAARQQATEKRLREAQRRQLIQQIKWVVIDMFVTWERISPEAIAEAKEEIERKLSTLPILELPVHELQQLGTAIREKVYRSYRTREVPVFPPPHQTATPMTVHHAPREVAMPMHRILSGFFMCPSCDEEFELDLTPEKEAVCPDCGVRLEEFDEEDDDGDED